MTGSPSPRGRRRADEIPSERQRHLACLASATYFKMPLPAIARINDVSLRTVQLWIAKARGYPEASSRESLLAHLNS